jgi:predicted solute-binding protein
MFRIGSVPYLNALPLTCGLEAEVFFAPPAELARRLRADALEAALVSVTEVLFSDRYEVLDGVAIGSDGPVRSVVLAHRAPLNAVRVVHCDPASLTSVNLLKVLLTGRRLAPQFVPLADYRLAGDLDAVLLIGDRALDFSLTRHPHTVWDLGEAWRALTGLPFVFAVWALRRDTHTGGDRERLREARQRGLAELDRLIATWPAYTPEFRKRYLTENVRFGLGPDEKRGLARFSDLIARHELGRVHPVRYVT